MKINRLVRPWQRRPKEYRKLKRDHYYQTREWTLRRTAFIKEHPFCAICMREENRLTLCYPKPYSGVVDHITPRAKGGSDDEDNLQTLCYKHDAIKRAQDK